MKRAEGYVIWIIRIFVLYTRTFVNGAHTTAALWWMVREILPGAIFFVDTDTENRSTTVQFGWRG
jgi:hypothetical protein